MTEYLSAHVTSLPNTIHHFLSLQYEGWRLTPKYGDCLRNNSRFPGTWALAFPVDRRFVSLRSVYKVAWNVEEEN